MKEIKNDILKSIVVVCSIIIFVVGIVVSAVNTGDTYAATDDVTVCGAGTFYSGQGICEKCLEGYYCPGGIFNTIDTSRDGIELCPSGTTSPEGASSSLACTSSPTTYTIYFYNENTKFEEKSCTKSPTDSYCTVSVPSTEPTKEGYTFVGWSKDCSNSNNQKFKSALYVNYHNANKKYYACFEKQYFEVEYDANGGAGAPASQKKTEKVDLTLSSTKPTREGYTFVNWNTSKDGKGISYNVGGKYTSDANVILYAQWKEVTSDTEKVQILYGDVNLDGIVTSDDSIYLLRHTLYPNDYPLTDEGKTNADVNLDGVLTDIDATIIKKYVDKNVGYEKLPYTKKEYEVKYDANGGTGAPAIQKKTEKTDLTLSSTKPTRDGYTFVSWNSSKDGKGTSYSAGSKYTSDANLTLYAQWKEVTSDTKKEYEVKYDANGGTGAPASQKKTEKVDLTLSSTKPTREGYTFVNWNTSKDGKGTTYNVGGKYTSDANVILYAQWKVVTNNTDKTDEEVDTNNNTGDALIYTAWIVGMGALGYVVYYYSKRKNDI